MVLDRRVAGSVSLIKICYQPLDHLVQRHDPCRGEHARLAHAAAQHLAVAPRLPTASRQAAGFDPLAALIDKRPFTALGSSVIYGQTKLMNIMFSQELSRQLKGTGVAVNCLCPGFNVTGLGRELSFAAPLERLLTWLKIGNPERGAGIIVRLASDPAFADVTGGYFSVSDARPLVPVAPGADQKAHQALWQATAERVAAFRDVDILRAAGDESERLGARRGR